jgi:nicotinamide riboside kinase
MLVIHENAYALGKPRFELNLITGIMDTYVSIPNIYIIGPQSTGKTTLVNKIHDDLEHWLIDTSIETPHVIEEVARSVLSKHKFSAEDITSSTSKCLALQKFILEAQAVAEKEALRSSSWFISDRSGFDPLVYAKRYVSDNAVMKMQMNPAWKSIRARMESSLIVVCEAGTPWLVDDGVRLMPGSEEEWMQVFQDFCQLLNTIGFEYSVLPRTLLGLEDRAEFIRERWVERRAAKLSGTSI